MDAEWNSKGSYKESGWTQRREHRGHVCSLLDGLMPITQRHQVLHVKTRSLGSLHHTFQFKKHIILRYFKTCFLKIKGTRIKN